MAIKYGKFELPTKIKIDESPSSKGSARVVAEPFEKGFGHTVGNALRRILLTSLEAPAIISVMIEGVSHEYTGIEGVIEDMTHIILNLKKGLLRKLPVSEESNSRSMKVISRQLEVTQDMLDKNNGQYLVTLGELLGDSEFEVINPEMGVFTATKPMKRHVSFRVMIARGYMPSEAFNLASKSPNEILIDATFSPVRLVNYFVENCRVGGDTDMDRLVLEVTTDGRITAKEAVTFAAQIGILHLSVFDELKFQTITYEEDQEEEGADRDALLNKLSLKISEIELSVRSTNCLAQANIETIAELVIMAEPEMLKFRNFGKKSLNEIKAKLEEMGMYLGMDLAKYGITRENVKEAVHQLVVSNN
ncbi:MAG: DNA-directed RNA polymerase subunit alpha [Chlamydiae bacterium]|jgi:DNA-directed RNA polymerase subunit alpha|nr:DNA-directed RNA polymerase subunit alpha [Chlamydiota bacterium]